MSHTHAPALGQLTVVVQDMAASVAFDRRLGLTIEAEPGTPHVAVELAGGLMLELDEVGLVPMWDAGWSGRTGGSTVLGFSLPTPAAVDELYADLTGAGHHGHEPPYDAFWGGRYAIVDDPDGNGVGLMTAADDALAHWPPVPPPRG